LKWLPFYFGAIEKGFGVIDNTKNKNSGKSTVAALMTRFYDPDKGTLFFDGVDAAKLDPIWLRNQIGLVPQGATFLFYFQIFVFALMSCWLLL